jgi:Domain of unknown function (DUF4760)
MVTIIEVTAVLSSIAAISAAIFLIIELKHMDRHKDLEISMKLFEWAETESLRKAFRRIEEDFQFENLPKYEKNVAENFDVGDYPYQVEAFFEEVGFLVNKKLVDIDVIVDRLGSHIVTDWKKLQPWILAVREERNDKTFGEHFEILYKKTSNYMQKPKRLNLTSIL